MARSERNGADRTSTEARARFRETAEQLAVRLRWLSIVAIPALAYLSAEPVHSPWFEGLVVGAGIYNFALSHALARGRGGPALSLGTAVLDSVFLFLMCWLSGGIHSAIITYNYLAMVSVCMRLPIAPSLGIGTLYAGELALLASMDGSLLTSQLAVKIAYVFLAVAFVSPLVLEARNRFAGGARGSRGAAPVAAPTAADRRGGAPAHRRRAPRSRRRCSVLLAARTAPVA